MEVISSIIRAEVTVVDEELNRIYGTGFYQSEEIPAIAKKKSSAFFGSILREGTPKLVTDICNDAVCKECERHDLCTIKAEMGYPLEEQGEIIGIIGISAFEEKAGEYIKENYDRLLEFLKYIGILICSQLKTVEQVHSMSKQLGEVSRQTSQYHLIGESEKMRRLIALGRRVAASDSTVLITGETGTGKEDLRRDKADSYRYSYRGGYKPESGRNGEQSYVSPGFILSPECHPYGNAASAGAGRRHYYFGTAFSPPLQQHAPQKHPWI